jgi:methanogenic corrinoid protein MtbC1/CheY-like chemotaxis protein
MLYELGPRATSVYRVLIERIQSGELAAGTRLPGHTHLAASFDVAPLTVRQVLARLESEGLVARERGRGTFVRGAQGAGRPHVLVVGADSRWRAHTERHLRTAGLRPVLAATPAEATAALAREALPSLAIVDLRLPTPSVGLRLVRQLRQRLPQLVIAVVNPTRGQRTRLQHTVAPPLRFLGAELADLAEAVSALESLPTPTQAAPNALVAEALDRLLESYLDLQLLGARTEARSLILQEGRALGLTVTELFRSVLEPAQRRLGELWQTNQISVAREHLGTGVTEAVMADLVAAAPRASRRGMLVLVACVEGEMHDIGARMLADLLELDGFSVLFLGADVPTDSLLAIIGEESAEILVLSATMVDRLTQLAVTVARVRQMYSAGVRIFVGGQVMDSAPQAVHALAVDLATRDALETLSAVRRLGDMASR